MSAARARIASALSQVRPMSEAGERRSLRVDVSSAPALGYSDPAGSVPSSRELSVGTGSRIADGDGEPATPVASPSSFRAAAITASPRVSTSVTSHTNALRRAAAAASAANGASPADSVHSSRNGGGDDDDDGNGDIDSVVPARSRRIAELVRVASGEFGSTRKKATRKGSTVGRKASSVSSPRRKLTLRAVAKSVSRLATPTATSSARVRAPATPRAKVAREVGDLKAAVESLASEAVAKQEIEEESQAVLDRVAKQCKSLRSSFGTASAAIIEVSDEVAALRQEAAAIRAEAAAGFDEGEQRRAEGEKRAADATHAVKSEVAELRRQVEALVALDRERSSEVEELRADLQDARAENEQLRVELGEVRAFIKDVRIEAKEARRDLEREVDALRDVIAEQSGFLKEEMMAQDRKIEGLRLEVRDQVQKRVADLEVLEEAITATGRQHGRLRATVEESLDATAAEVQTLRTSANSAAALAEACREDNNSLQRALRGLSSDSKRRYDDLARVVEGLSDTLRRLTLTRYPPPPSPPKHR